MHAHHNRFRSRCPRLPRPFCVQLIFPVRSVSVSAARRTPSSATASTRASPKTRPRSTASGSSAGSARLAIPPSRCCPVFCSAFAITCWASSSKSSWRASRTTPRGMRLNANVRRMVCHAPRTIGRWCRAFAAQAATWWAAVQATLACQDSASPALDPLGPAAGPYEAPRALLHAATHLLAWAQTRWPEVVSYGLQRSPALPLALGLWPRSGTPGLTHTVCGLCSVTLA